ncbi:MAG TPA: type II toxin-antitoxin system prevent-host-death family antitoxin [Candidatus Cybelea sp.]|jgi:prevent-host-death family protein|nr:type II toxin-antitoxin system prevent-host-death family antitoxin [Candidatus Cybelea sp.]
MRHASVGEAKAHFSALIKQAEAGEQIVVTRSGVPVARIVPERSAKERSFADDEGLGFVGDDFDKPLPPDVLKLFYQ